MGVGGCFCRRSSREGKHRRDKCSSKAGQERGHRRVQRAAVEEGEEEEGAIAGRRWSSPGQATERCKIKRERERRGMRCRDGRFKPKKKCMEQREKKKKEVILYYSDIH